MYWPALIPGVLLSIYGVLALGWPELAFRVSTRRRFEDPSHTQAGRLDLRLTGGVILVLGVLLLDIGV